MQELSSQQAVLLLKLRSVIARAAQKDSLRWWEDESFTPPGVFVLDRVLPGATAISSRNLSITAAACRHRMVLGELNRALHLFSISAVNADRLALRRIRHHQGIGILPPIPDMESLRQHLLDIIGTAPLYQSIRPLSPHGGMRIKLSSPAPDIEAYACALAWAYLEGKIGHPVFPYIVEP